MRSRNDFNRIYLTSELSIKVITLLRLRQYGSAEANFRIVYRLF